MIQYFCGVALFTIGMLVLGMTLSPKWLARVTIIGMAAGAAMGIGLLVYGVFGGFNGS